MITNLTGYDALLASDPVLRRIADQRGRPDPYAWPASPATVTTNFAAMVLHIVSQQLSTAAAAVIYARVRVAAGGSVTVASILAAGEVRLHAAGLSRRKATSIGTLAQMQRSGELDLRALDHVSDQDAVRVLTSAPGVGQWTADMFLIHQLRRPDVLPAGDLGIRQAVQGNWCLADLPSIDAVRALGAPWAPWRTFAAALLWSSLKPIAAEMDAHAASRSAEKGRSLRIL